MVERAAVLTDANGRFVVDPSAAVGESSSRTGGERLTLQRHWEAAQDVKIEEGAGAHGGGDALLLADIFRGPEMTGWNDRRIGWTGSRDRGRNGRQRVIAHRSADQDQRSRPRC